MVVFLILFDCMLITLYLSIIIRQKSLSNNFLFDPLSFLIYFILDLFFLSSVILLGKLLKIQLTPILILHISYLNTVLQCFMLL